MKNQSLLHGIELKLSTVHYSTVHYSTVLSSGDLRIVLVKTPPMLTETPQTNKMPSTPNAYSFSHTDLNVLTECLCVYKYIKCLLLVGAFEENSHTIALTVSCIGSFIMQELPDIIHGMSDYNNISIFHFLLYTL